MCLREHRCIDSIIKYIYFFLYLIWYVYIRVHNKRKYSSFLLLNFFYGGWVKTAQITKPKMNGSRNIKINKYSACVFRYNVATHQTWTATKYTQHTQKKTSTSRKFGQIVISFLISFVYGAHTKCGNSKAEFKKMNGLKKNRASNKHEWGSRTKKPKVSRAHKSVCSFLVSVKFRSNSCKIRSWILGKIEGTVWNFLALI